MSSKQSFTLYYNQWSICSQMVLLTLAFRGEPQDANTEMVVDKQAVDLFASEQLEESFLTEINSKGQVPVLKNPDLLPKPIAESLDITYYIAKQYPTLLPESHKDQIIALLKELHDINYFSLSFGSRPAAAKAQKAAVEVKLANSEISEKYRKALEYKLTVVQNEKVNGVTAEEIEAQKINAGKFLEKIGGLYEPVKGPWLWGSSSPSALDVHVAIFLGRLHDVGRAELVPEQLVRFYRMVKETKEWGDVYQGGKTMIGV